MYDVVALGELLIDFTTISTDGNGYPTMVAHPGGAPANFLAAVAKFGGKVAMLGEVGSDTFGRLLIGTLRDAGIETKGVVTSDDYFTTMAYVTLDENGDRDFAFARKPGADTQLRFDEIDLSLIENTRVFHFGTLSLTDDPSRSTTYKAVKYAKRQGAIITFDPNLRKPLWNNIDEAKTQMLWGLEHADIVKISDEEVGFLFNLGVKEGAEYILANFNVKLVFVTCGADGCWFQNRKAAGHVDSLRDICVVDTTGAGDIFGGAAVWKVLQFCKSLDELTEKELRQIVSFACKVAGLSATKFGGISSVLELEDVIN